MIVQYRFLHGQHPAHDLGPHPDVIVLHMDALLSPSIKAAAALFHHLTCYHPPSAAHCTGPAYILRLLRRAPARSFDTALLAGGWNLLNFEGAEVLQECEHRGVAVHLAGVFGGTGQVCVYY